MGTLNWDISKLLSGLQTTPSRFESALMAYAEQGALKLQNFAQQNRKWTDRTGHARQRLKGSTSKIVNGVRITLAHGVDYGIWLELANEKRYAIIPYAIRFVGTFEIMPGFQSLMERMK